jgi:tetratricopeptide (TPR) repeat protein
MKFKLSPAAEKKRRAAALTQLGIDLHDRGRFDAGAAAFGQALALEPGRVRAIRGEALCLSQLGKAQEALAYAEKAVELARDPGLAYSTLGLVLHRLGRREEAEKAFQLGLENTPDDFRVYYNFACYWAEVGDEEECRRYLALALELAPESFVRTGSRRRQRYNKIGSTRGPSLKGQGKIKRWPSRPPSFLIAIYYS